MDIFSRHKSQKAVDTRWGWRTTLSKRIQPFLGKGGGLSSKIKTARAKVRAVALLHLLSVEQFLRDVPAVGGDLTEDFLVEPGIHLR